VVPIGTDLLVSETSNARNRLLDPSWRNSTYRFCRQQCNLFTFRLMDSLDHKVNPQSLQLAGGSCDDTFWAGPATWSTARAKPPAPLVQFYVQCVNTLMQSIVISFGSAAGTAAPLTAVFVMLLVVTIGRLWDWHKHRAARGAGRSEDGDGFEDPAATAAAGRVDASAMHDVCMDLKRHWVMGEFSMHQLRQLVARSAVVGYGVGERVYSSGEAADCAYYVISGVFHISRTRTKLVKGQVRNTAAGTYRVTSHSPALSRPTRSPTPVVPHLPTHPLTHPHPPIYHCHPPTPFLPTHPCSQVFGDTGDVRGETVRCAAGRAPGTTDAE
jgi:hypothetical protein